MKLMIAAIFLIVAFPHSTIADPSIKDFAIRTEVHSIETLTVSVRQFLTGARAPGRNKVTS